MITQFKTLFVLTVVHTYYSENCQDVSFILPADTAQLLRNGKLLTKELNGSLYVLFETDEAGAALVKLGTKTLRLGLTLNNPYFVNFTALASNFTSTELLFRNKTTPTNLDAPVSVIPRGGIFSHPLSDSDRPVTVTLKNAAGVALQTDEVTADNDRTSVSYNLTGQAPGAMTVVENYPGNTIETIYYLDPELLSAGAFGVVEIQIDNSFYTAAPEFAVSFQPRAETLKYYVVGTKYSQADIDQLSVADAGFTEENRTQITFSKVPANSFTADDIPPDLLTNDSALVVLFKSQATVTRSATARKKIQLKKNGEVLITHLPQPSADQATADQIISVAKP